MRTALVRAALVRAALGLVVLVGVVLVGEIDACCHVNGVGGAGLVNTVDDLGLCGGCGRCGRIGCLFDRRRSGVLAVRRRDLPVRERGRPRVVLGRGLLHDRHGGCGCGRKQAQCEQYPPLPALRRSNRVAGHHRGSTLAPGYGFILGGGRRGRPNAYGLGQARNQLVDDLVPCGVHFGRESGDCGLQLGGCHLDTVLEAWPGPDLGVLSGLADSGNNPLSQLVGHSRSRVREGL